MNVYKYIHISICPVIPWELTGRLPVSLISADSSSVADLHAKELRVVCVSLFRSPQRSPPGCLSSKWLLLVLL